MIEHFPLLFLTKMKTRSSSPYNRADRQNRKQEARSKKQEVNERPVSGSDTAAQCSLMCDGSLALALAQTSGTMNRSFWRTGSVRQV